VNRFAMSWRVAICLGLLAPLSAPSDDRSAGSRAAQPVPALSPEQALDTFQLAAGLRMELVAGEPMVQDPVAMTFDEDGRLWVVEMRGFMPNLDREGEEEPTGRVSVLEDTDGDGRMDKGTVFLDGLVLPRAIAVVNGGALVAENKPLWFAEDTDGDGRADRKTLIDAEYGGTGMPEHAGNGLWRGLDNWYYNAKSKSRYRLRAGRWVREETEFRGQWGICHDDFGRLFYNYNWSQLHTDLAPPNALSRNPHHTPGTGIGVGVATNQTVFPLHATPAVNRGYIPGALDERGRLREFTSAGAPLIYRGDALPAEFRGNAFVCEPAGNLVKRNLVFGGGLEPASRFAHADREFLASTDERFRPVFLADGPDGALYVVDMYRGVIQHGAYMTPYLREQSLARGLVEPRRLGRIWRIVPKGWKRPKPLKLSQAGSGRLIELLSHANGWVRDTAQRLLVERGDRSLLPPLRQAAARTGNPFGRIHSLWTLEGLGDREPARLTRLLNDHDPRVQAAAIRVLDRMAAGDATAQAALLTALTRLHRTAAPEVRLQIALTAGNLDGAGCLPLLAGCITRDAEQPLLREAVMSSLRDREFTFLKRLWADPRWRDEASGRAIFFELLASAVIRAGRRDDVQALLELLDRPPAQFAWREKSVLAGVAVHAGRRGFEPIQLNRPPGLLAHAAGFTERAVRSRVEKLPLMFSWQGHEPQKAPRPEARPLDAEEEELFVSGRQQYLVVCAGCHGPDGAGLEPLGPPLLDSPWVLGSAQRLVRILLHGMEGPLTIGGVRYEPPRILPEMPSLAVLDNASVAAVLTYVRREWGHAADPVAPDTVSLIRINTQGRGRPWTETELLNSE
jgi:mono/diheme cytochrome c family protein/glucose/arabinose dehydrogenase